MNKSILIVDDEELVRDSLGDILSDEGYIIQYASSGEEGLSIYKKIKPDISLLDYTLPDMKGDILSRKIKEYDSSSKIIIMSGYDKDQINCKYADDVLTKPIGISKLFNTIERLV